MQQLTSDRQEADWMPVTNNTLNGTNHMISKCEKLTVVGYNDFVTQVLLDIFTEHLHNINKK